MLKYRIGAVVLLLASLGLGFFVYNSSHEGARFPFRFGLDLIGGTELVYKADVSSVPSADIKSSMDTLRDVIERRVNIFGVSEPLIQVEEAGLISGNRDYRLIVELPGVTDIQKAIDLIGQTPSLEFRLETPEAKAILENQEASQTTQPDLEKIFASTGITGKVLKRATLEFSPTTNAPMVGLQFNEEGKQLLTKVTRENKGKVLAIFLDGQLIEAPVINDDIDNGIAQISGGFTIETARNLVRSLNYGALPLPIELQSTASIGATLGQSALNGSVKAGILGFALVVLFLILWYRLPGFIASIALVIYVLISLALFKLIPVTLTAAGLAGFILSIGMAVDANVLIFERMKEELRNGKNLNDAIHEGFHRAWLSIRDSNISSIITAVVLFWLGTSAVKGFALTLGVGVLVSMFTAITASRTLLYALGVTSEGRVTKFLFGSGIK